MALTETTNQQEAAAALAAALIGSPSGRTGLAETLRLLGKLVPGTVGLEPTNRVELMHDATQRHNLMVVEPAGLHLHEQREETWEAG